MNTFLLVHVAPFSPKPSSRWKRLFYFYPHIIRFGLNYSIIYKSYHIGMEKQYSNDFFFFFPDNSNATIDLSSTFIYLQLTKQKSHWPNQGKLLHTYFKFFSAYSSHVSILRSICCLVHCCCFSLLFKNRMLTKENFPGCA